MTVASIIAHRGASGHAPENTLAALDKAADLGATWVEFDCMMCAGADLVVHHDEDLKRITGDARAVPDCTVDEIQKLDAGSWFDGDFASERIPTLAQVIALLEKRGLGANAEIKPATGFEKATGTLVAQQLKKLWPDSLPTPVISSFSEEALVESLKVLPQIEHAILWEGVPEDWRQAVQRMGATAVHCEGDLLREDQARAIKAAGLPLRCYTVNDLELGQRLLEWGVDALITDFPERFLG